MSRTYTEGQLFEQSAIGLCGELSWTTVTAGQHLRQKRDLLLPRLLSGQVNLKTA